jgi:hypothetical protein
MRRYTQVHDTSVRAGYPGINNGNSLGNTMTTTRQTHNHVSPNQLHQGYSQSGRSIERVGFMDINGGNGIGNTNMPGILGRIRNSFSASKQYDDARGSYRSHPLAGVGAMADYSAYSTGATGSSYTNQASSIPSYTTPAYDSSGTSALTTSSTLTNSLTNLATGVLTSLTSAAVASVLAPSASMSAAQLAALNAQRIAAGEVPYNADGSLMSAAQMAAAGYSSSQISAVGLTASSDLLLIGGAAAILVVILLATHKRS